MDCITDYFKALQLANNQDISIKIFEDLLFSCLDNTKLFLHKKGQRKFGTPDFKISNVAGVIGYCETKKVGENLDEILKSEQIKKYLELTPNLLLTDYCTFIWVKNGIENIRLAFCEPEIVGNPKAIVDAQKVVELEHLITNFLRATPQGISTTRELAKALAVRTKALKDFLFIELSDSQAVDNVPRLLGLYQTFQQTISSELSYSDFSDAYAQMLAYGLFLAKLNADTKNINLNNTPSFIPKSFELIRELTLFLTDLEDDHYQTIRWTIEEILTILNHLDLPEIQKSLSFNRESEVQADPYLYFYEDFLGEYDKKLRKAKGVYYTPPAVVNFIVRATNEVLKNTFGISNGLANRDQVTVLDFATGTGTFLLEIVRQILSTLPKFGTLAKLVVKDHILKNIYGFEYLIAPYTIAHLKLSQFLHEQGYDLKAKERLQIYLTNTLEPLNTQTNYFLPALSKEGKAAQNVKQQPILVITGNPPYSGHSTNKGKWISDRVEEYKIVGNEVLQEKNLKWLQDDYVKFIRFAEWKMQQVQEGMVAIITNHSFLDNPTFRLMRKSLMTTFNQLYIIDLHGNAKKKEVSDDGSKDENVFDIQQGVSISIFIKKENLSRKIFHTDFYGTRKTKFDKCFNSSINELNWTELQAKTPHYLFVPQNITHKEQYENGWSIKDIFAVQSVGIATAKDDILTDKNKEVLQKRIEKFKKAEDIRQVRQWFNLPDSFNTKIKKVLENLQNQAYQIQAIAYRPFDKRWIWWETDLIERAREKVMQNFDTENIALVSVRNCQGVRAWEHCFVSKEKTDLHLIPIGTYVFPLYRHDESSENYTYLFSDENGKKSNFTPAFKTFVTQHFGDSKVEARAIFNYIYAILNSSVYREKYIGFLKMDFPKIPFCSDMKIFTALEKIGNELVQAHLLEKGAWQNLTVGEPMEEHTNEITEIRYKNNRLYYNDLQYFDEVSENVWKFEVGGYKVLEKYLRDRKGLNSSEDLFTIQNIIKAITFTLEQNSELEKMTQDWI